MSAPVVYRCYDRHGVLLYIGCTSNLTRRLNEWETAYPWWWRQVAHVSLSLFQTMQSAFAAEREAIIREFPKANVIYNVQACPEKYGTGIEDRRNDVASAMGEHPLYGSTRARLASMRNARPVNRADVERIAAKSGVAA